MAVTHTHTELVLRPPPGASWQVNVQGEAVLQLRRGTEEMAVAYLREWLDHYGLPMMHAANKIAAPAIAAAAPTAPLAPPAFAPSDSVTAKASPQALKLAAERCEAVHTNEIRTVRCDLAQGHHGAHIVRLRDRWYPLDIAPSPTIAPDAARVAPPPQALVATPIEPTEAPNHEEGT